MIKFKHQLDGYMDKSHGGKGYAFKPGISTVPIDIACFQKLRETGIAQNKTQANDFQLIRVDEKRQFLEVRGKSMYSDRSGAMQTYYIELSDEEFSKIGYDIRPILKEAYERINQNIAEEQQWPELEMDGERINQEKAERENRDWQMLRELFGGDRKATEEFFRCILSGRRLSIADDRIEQGNTLEFISGVRNALPAGIRKEMTFAFSAQLGIKLFGTGKQFDGAMFYRRDNQEAKGVFFNNFGLADEMMPSYAEKIAGYLLNGQYDEIRNLAASEEGESITREFLEKQEKFTQAELEYQERKMIEKNEKERLEKEARLAREKDKGLGGMFKKMFR